MVPIVQSALSYKGIADLCATRYGRTVWVECKTATGKQSDDQRRFEADILEHGGEYLLARSTADVACLCDCLPLTPCERTSR